jgi:ATP-dependent DNA ligase
VLDSSSRCADSRADGLVAWQTVVNRGLEGLVAKDLKATYDARTRWLKVKVRHEGTYVIGGVTFHEERVVVGEREGRHCAAADTWNSASVCVAWSR